MPFLHSPPLPELHGAALLNGKRPRPRARVPLPPSFIPNSTSPSTQTLESSSIVGAKTKTTKLSQSHSMSLAAFYTFVQRPLSPMSTEPPTFAFSHGSACYGTSIQHVVPLDHFSYSHPPSSSSVPKVCVPQYSLTMNQRAQASAAASASASFVNTNYLLATSFLHHIDYLPHAALLSPTPTPRPLTALPFARLGCRRSQS